MAFLPAGQSAFILAGRLLESTVPAHCRAASSALAISASTASAATKSSGKLQSILPPRKPVKPRKRPSQLVRPAPQVRAHWVHYSSLCPANKLFADERCLQRTFSCFGLCLYFFEIACTALCPHPANVTSPNRWWAGALVPNLSLSSSLPQCRHRL